MKQPKAHTAQPRSGWSSGKKRGRGRGWKRGVGILAGVDAEGKHAWIRVGTLTPYTHTQKHARLHTHTHIHADLHILNHVHFRKPTHYF